VGEQEEEEEERYHNHKRLWLCRRSRSRGNVVVEKKVY
jgi:hypothetical protein